MDNLTCYIEQASPDAVIPTKANADDRGYDITLIGIEKKIGPVTFYTTGLRVELPTGWSWDLVPRSSISKKCHMLVNSFGVLDPGYRGIILAALWKLDPEAPDLELPDKTLQLLLRAPTPDVDFVIRTLDLKTARGVTGFGDSDKIKGC